MLPAFQIARFPVTVAEYACAVRAGVMRAPAVDSYSPISWPIQLARPDHPVVNISWHDAMAYAKWLAARTGQPWWRLPTEAEWEKAARFDPTSGTSERIYPWGDPFDRSRCNTSESRIGTTMPVGRYPAGESPSGARDMAGNVWEWTVCAYADDYSQVTIRSVTDALESRVRRGGSWRDTAWHARAGRRVDLHPHNISEDLGFRLVYALPQLIP
jgi:formylglycine-generating enzyme required for sulfatase activity